MIHQRMTLFAVAVLATPPVSEATLPRTGTTFLMWGWEHLPMATQAGHRQGHHRTRRRLHGRRQNANAVAIGPRSLASCSEAVGIGATTTRKGPVVLGTTASVVIIQSLTGEGNALVGAVSGSRRLLIATTTTPPPSGIKFVMP